MTGPAEPDIGLDYMGLQLARARKTRELMADYDRDVYVPALRALREKCAAIGHKAADRWDSNGLGWHFRYCGACGSRVESVGPEDTP